MADSLLVHRLKRPRGLKCLVEDFHVVDARYHCRGWQVERIMQTLHRCDGFALEDKRVAHRFHSQDPDFVGNQSRKDLLLETPKMRIHDVQGHLHGVEAEFVSGGDLQHPEMNEWILVAGKTDVTDFPRLP